MNAPTTSPLNTNHHSSSSASSIPTAASPFSSDLVSSTTMNVASKTSRKDPYTLLSRSVEDRRAYCNWEGRNQWLYALERCKSLEDMNRCMADLEKGFPLFSTVPSELTSHQVVRYLQKAICKKYGFNSREGLTKLWNDICTFGVENPPYHPSCFIHVSRAHLARGLEICLGLDVSWEALEEMLVQMASNTLFVTYKAFLRVFEDTRGKKSCGRADPDDVCSAMCEAIEVSGLNAAEVFRSLDLNGDGYISLAEFVSSFKQYTKRRKDLHTLFQSFHPLNGKVNFKLFSDRMLRIYIERFKALESKHKYMKSGCRDQLLWEAMTSRCEEFLYSLYRSRKTRLPLQTSPKTARNRCFHETSNFPGRSANGWVSSRGLQSEGGRSTLEEFAIKSKRRYL